MTPQQLEELFTRYGYILVWDIHAYSAFHLTDIIEDKVREGACAICAFSAFVLDDLRIEDAERFLVQCTASTAERTPFDRNRTYRVGLPKKQELPEWRGVPVEKLREVFGW